MNNTDPRLKLMALYMKVTASKFIYPKGLNDEKNLT